MNVHISKRFPFGKFSAINLFGHVFIKESYWEAWTDKRIAKTIRHEAIHTEQMKELLYVPFYLIYFVGWLYWAIFRTERAYRHINFEKEAYRHEGEIGYCETRKNFAQWRSSK